MFTEVAECSNSIKFDMVLADYFLEHVVYEAECSAISAYQECKESAIPFDDDKKKILIEATQKTLKDKIVTFLKTIKVKIEKMVFTLIKSLRKFCTESSNKFKKLLGKDDSVIVDTRSIDIPMVFKYIEDLVSKLASTMEISKPFIEAFKETAENKNATPYMIQNDVMLGAEEVYQRYFSNNLGFTTLAEVRNIHVAALKIFNTARVSTRLTVKEIRDYSTKIEETSKRCELMRAEYEKYRMYINNLTESIENNTDLEVNTIQKITIFTTTVSDIIISLSKAIAFTCRALETRIKDLVDEAEKALK